MPGLQLADGGRVGIDHQREGLGVGAHERAPRAVLLGHAAEGGADVVVGRHVEQPRARRKRRRRPVLAAPVRRAEGGRGADAGLLRLVVARPASLGIERREHVLLHVRLGVHVGDAAVAAPFEKPQIAVAAGVDEAGDRPAGALEVDQQRRRDLVPVPRIVPVVLVVAAHLAGFHIQRDHRGGVQIVAGAHVAGPRAAIAGAPVGQLGGGVEGAGDPHRHAAGLPGITRPGFAAGFPRRGDRVRLPRRFAAGRVERRHEAANAELAAGNPDHDLAFGRQRREGHVVAAPVVLHFGFPHDVSRRGVQGHEVAVRSGHEHQLAVERDAPIRGVHLREVLRQIALIAPTLLAARRIQRQQVVVRRGDEHGAVVDHRRRLMAFAHAGGEGPQRLQASDVLGVDLIQRAVALGIVGAPVHQPVLRRRIRQPRIGDGRILRRGGKRRQDARHDNDERRHRLPHDASFQPRSLLPWSMAQQPRMGKLRRRAKSARRNAMRRDSVRYDEAYRLWAVAPSG